MIALIRAKVETPKKPIPYVRYEKMVEAVFDVISNAVMNENKEVRISKFGTFKKKVLAPTERRNPRTNETFMAKENVKLSFRCSRVNKPTANTEVEKKA